MVLGDTIAAIATAQGRGGVAVIRVSGPEAHNIAAKLTGKNFETRAMRFCRVCLDETLIDECLVLSFKAPHSYTGEDVVEFQVHGGAITPRRILNACFSCGARLARRGEFTERAFLNGKLSYEQAESVLNLIDAKTSRAADAALEGISGRRENELRSLYAQALDLSTNIEHSLDVDEEDFPEGFLDSLHTQYSRLQDTLSTMIRRASEGKILREGAMVVLAGPPNAGKSSLMNALLEENRAIVSDTPGTTRDSIEEWLDLDGWPIRLVDTAGLRETEDKIESEGVRRSEQLIAKADLVLCLGDMQGPEGSVLVHSKCDVERGDGLNVSAVTGEGLDELKRVIVKHLQTKIEKSESTLDVGVAVLYEIKSMLEDAPKEDLVLLGNAVRLAAERLGAAIGSVYSEDLLNNLFSRFCVGK